MEGKIPCRRTSTGSDIVITRDRKTSPLIYSSQAHQHLFVAKNQKAAVISSTVRRLGDEERVEEVARMLGGVTITENTLAHAREMLESAKANG